MKGHALGVIDRREILNVKLGKRLKKLETMVTGKYDHIWDSCCDHGLLGAALLSRQAAPYIHFVDVVPELMQQLENKLVRFFPDNVQSTSQFISQSISCSQWQVHCMDVSALPLQSFQGKHLVIIAGVGGDLMAELVQAIYHNNPTADMDFLLCPVHHQYTLRQQLIQLDLNLQTEVLLVENERYYEVLLISKNTHNARLHINPVGDLLWQSTTPEESKNVSRYLSKTLAHYQRMQLSCASDVQHIIDAYSAVEKLVSE